MSSHQQSITYEEERFKLCILHRTSQHFWTRDSGGSRVHQRFLKFGKSRRPIHFSTQG